MTRITVGTMLLLLAACTSVDSTDHCVETRYGKVVNPRMSEGLNWTGFNDATCFTMTEKNYPEGEDEDGKQKSEILEAQTKDPVTVVGDLAIVYQYDPATINRVFLDKRSAVVAEAEIVNAIREGYRNALATFSINPGPSNIFDNRPALADSVRAQIQRKLTYQTKDGPMARAIIKNAFVRNIKVPQAIEDARVAFNTQQLVLEKQRKQFEIDSVSSRAELMVAQNRSEAKRLEAQSYAANPQLLSFEIAKAQASGMAQICGNATTCIIGDAGLSSLVGVKR